MNFSTTQNRITSIGFLWFLFGVLLFSPHTLMADTKTFAYTYPARTIQEGELELEHYLDAGLQQWNNPATEKKETAWSEVDWKHQVEFEYGITNAWDFGFYNVFSQKPYSDFKYEGIKLRTRYNFGEGRHWRMDPGLYLEVGYFGDAVKFEEMAILSLTENIFETSLNLKAEQEIEYGGSSTEVEHELIISYAAGFHIGAQTALSLEYYGKAKFEEGELDYFVNYLGPTFHVAAGPFYWNIAAQPQLGNNKDKAAIRFRSIFAVLF